MKVTRALPLAAVPLAVLLAGCGPDAGAAPTIGQTSYAPGNEDPCVWDGTRWAEADDGEDCDQELNHGSLKRPTATATVTRPTHTTTTRRAASTRTARTSAPARKNRS